MHTLPSTNSVTTNVPTSTVLLGGANSPAKSDAPSHAAVQALTQNLRNTPAYSAAYELELWKKAQEEAFKNKLKEDEKRFR